jgi:hypothetical protein
LTRTLDANGTLMKGVFKLSSRSSGGEGSFTATKQRTSYQDATNVWMLEHVLDGVRQFTAGAVLSDELTGLVLRYTGVETARP